MAALPDSSEPLILYIMGAGRSGTTILEVVLTGNTGVAGVGEVTHLFKDGYINNDVCACGVRTSECTVWRRVRDRCAWTDRDVVEIARLFRKMDWHSGFWSAWRGSQDAPAFLRYEAVNRSLFSSVAEIHKPSVIVDSSKYGARALNLLRVFGPRLRVLCITRSPEGLLTSFRKSGSDHSDEQKPKSHVALIAYYFFVLISMRLVQRRLGSQGYAIRYEDMVSKPDDVLIGIQNWLGVDLTESRNRIAGKLPFTGGHIVTGNRLRKSPAIVFRTQQKDPEVVGWMSRTTVLVMRGMARLIAFGSSRNP